MSHLLFLYKFILEQSHASSLLHCLWLLQWRGGIIVTKWLAKPKLFAPWPFTDKVGLSCPRVTLLGVCAAGMLTCMFNVAELLEHSIQHYESETELALTWWGSGERPLFPEV